MSKKTELPDELEILVQKVTKSHLENMKNNITQDNIKIPTIDVSERLVTALNDFSERNEDNHVIAEGIKKIISDVDDLIVAGDALALVVYDFIKTVYAQTNFKRHCYIPQLLEFYFGKIQEYYPNLQKEKYRKLLKVILPYLKLEQVSNHLQEGIQPLPLSLVHIMEYIRFPRILREDCYEIVFNKIKSTDFEILGFDLNPLGRGFGFLGDHYKLIVRVKKEKIQSDHHFFAKFIPTTNKTCEEISLIVFKKEEFVYKQLIQTLLNYKLEKFVDFAPNCYLTKTNEFIVLEDLSLLGFKSSEITIPAEFNWVILVAKQLSKLHACSIIIDKMLSKQIGETRDIGKLFEEYLEEVVYNEKYAISLQLMNFGIRLISEYFADKLSDICTKLSVEMFKQKIKAEAELVSENVRKSDKFYNVLCHGDIWSTNVMTNSTNSCVLIDYQLIRYCPPAHDLLYAIYTNTDRDFRQKHMDEISNVYYNNLRDNLRLYDIHLSEFYERKTFFESLDYYRSSAIIQALACLQINLLPKSVAEEMNKSEERSYKFFFEDRQEYFDAAWSYDPFSTRIRGLMEDLYEVCETK